MENLTAQQVFDRVSDHLLTQKKKSLRPKSGWLNSKKPECAYRGVGGLKCAVGCLLTDEDMKIVCENVVASAFSGEFETIKNNEILIDDLQGIHDTRKPSRWISKLALLAKRYNLDASVLKKYRKPKHVVVAQVSDVPLTKQQIFDKVATHLLTQMKKSMLDKNDPLNYNGSLCAYRGEGGLSCAVGCLITDDEVKAIGENASIELVVMKADRLIPFKFILSSLQFIHDYYKPSRWCEKLSAFAKREGLDKSVLEKFKK